MKVTLTRVTENPIGAIEEAACNCYNSEPTGGKIMKSCYNSGHHSVLEFCDFTFHVEGVSRALTHQLVRHRIASYAQRSQRYCGENDFDFVTPKSIYNNKEAWNRYGAIMRELKGAYEELQDLGVPNEDARMLLPNACETVIEVKMNLRSLIHFMNERLCIRAQWEIRLLATLMKEAIKDTQPEVYEKIKDWLVPKCEIHKKQPFCTEHSSCGRHPRLKDIYDDYVDLQILIDEAERGVITDVELVQKFWDTFIQPKGYTNKI